MNSITPRRPTTTSWGGYQFLDKLNMARENRVTRINSTITFRTYYIFTPWLDSQA
jgi:hypothetical protein